MSFNLAAAKKKKYCLPSCFIGFILRLVLLPFMLLICCEYFFRAHTTDDLRSKVYSLHFKYILWVTCPTYHKFNNFKKLWISTGS